MLRAINLSGVIPGPRTTILFQNCRRKPAYLALVSHFLTWFLFYSSAMWESKCFYAHHSFQSLLKVGCMPGWDGVILMGAHMFEASANYGFCNKQLRLWQLRAGSEFRELHGNGCGWRWGRLSLPFPLGYMCGRLHSIPVFARRQENGELGLLAKRLTYIICTKYIFIAVSS